jgi:hypothetical protein
MMRFFNRLLAKIAPDSTKPEPRLQKTMAHRAARSVRKKPPTKTPRRTPDLEYAGSISGKIVDGGPGKNVLIRNKYVREDSGTHETLKIVDDSLLDSDEEFGLDPYNTGRFDRARSWNSSRSRK